MVQKIIIIGGLLVDHDRQLLLDKLRQKSGNDYEWDWIKATAAEDWRPPLRIIRRFEWEIQQKPKAGMEEPKVAILWCLNGQIRNGVFRVCEEPVLVPEAIATGDDLFEWLTSAEAGLIPAAEWHSGTRATALICILEKLLRKKAFGKDMHGHTWVQEADILGQAPVDVPDRPGVRGEAVTLLSLLDKKMLISKGGDQGTTKREWCINAVFVPAVKKAITERSFDSLTVLKELVPLFNYVNDIGEHLYPLHEIISERVRAICRDSARDDAEVENPD